MARVLAVLVLLALAALLAGSTAYIPEGGSGDGGPPGMVGNTATDETIQYIYHLEHFQDLPDYQRYYFSEGTAGGVYGVGADTNPCTEALPCRTVELMTALANRGQVHIILDADDDWDLAADWGTANDIEISNADDCTNADEACVIFSSSSFSPSNRARLDCTNIVEPAGPGLFLWGDDTTGTHGWLAVENIEFNNCPPSLTSTYDLMRNAGTGAARMIGLNLKVVDGTKGSDGDSGQNDFFTSHSAGGDGGVGIFLNTETFVADAGTGYAADTFDATNGDMIVIGRSEIYSLDADGAANCIAGNHTPGNEIVFIGHTCNDRLGAQLTNGILINYAQAVGAASRMFIADVTFIGYGGGAIGGTQSSAVTTNQGGTNHAGTSMTVQIFRTTFSGFEQGIGETGAGIPANNTYSVQGRCLLMENPTATGRFINMYNGSGRSAADMTGITIDVQGIYDDEPNGVDYNFAGTTYNTAPLADAGLAATQHVFDTNSADSGGDGVNGDQFGTLASQYTCNSATCMQACSESTTSNWTFARYSIPRFVLGREVTKLSLGGQVTGHVGSR